MNWVAITWTMMISASLMLGVIHLFVWQKQRSQYANLLFFVLAVSAAAYGAYELARMRAETPADLAVNARLSHIPLAVFVIAAVGFVRLYFDAGRLWLAGAVIGIRLLALALNFLTGVNVNFQEITALHHLQLLGGAVVAGPVGTPNPWAIVPQLSNVLLVAFIVDASVTLWRRGGPVARRRAAFVGGSLALCVLMAGSFAALVVVGVVHAPTILMPGFFVVVLAMGYELVFDLIAAAKLPAQLRASEQRFRAVVDAAPSAILLVDRHGTITLANAQAEAVFGYRRAELVGRPMDMLLPARLRSRHSEWRAGFAEDPQVRAMGAGTELFACCQDGREIPIEVALSPMVIDDGTFVLASVVDITDRRKSERTNSRQRDELAHLSRVAMLGELSGSLAHELNQPLTAILSNAQAAQRFLKQDPPRIDKIPDILADIVSSDHRAGAVIARLRLLLRKEDAQRHALDVNEVVADSLRLMRSDLIDRRVDVATDLEPALPRVSGDRNQLQQVLLNFLINGCDAMEGQVGERQLRVRTCNADGGTVEIAVADRGTGIRPADLTRVFDPFVTTKAQGLGLGLSICRSIVEAHGGTVWASNNADRGATLHFALPAASG